MFVRGLIRWSLVGLFVAVALTGGAQAITARTHASRDAPTPQVFHVNVDAHNSKANEAFIAYFPSVIHVHAGDTVVFHWAGNGEPHTVTLGTLVDNAVSAFVEAHAGAAEQSAQVGDRRSTLRCRSCCRTAPATRSVGREPVLRREPATRRRTAACPKTTQPAFDGTQSFYNSGWKNSNAELHRSPLAGTRPGTYPSCACCTAKA